MIEHDDEFLRENEINLNDDMEGFFPDKTFTILRQSLHNYYSTSHVLKSFINRSYFFGINGNTVINDEASHEYLTYYYSAILYSQIFLELFIKAILLKVHVSFVRGRLNKEIDLIHALVGSLDGIKISDRSVNFSIILKRLELVIKFREKLPVALRLNDQYNFFIDHLPTIRKLTELRNEVVHDANIVLTAYSFDYFYSTRLIPLFNEILKLQERRITPMDRNLACELNVLQEISKTKLSLKYKDKNELDKIVESLNRLNHLKELGRASLENPLFMGEFDANVEALEKHHNAPIRSYAEVEAKLKADHLGYAKVFDCPCCGTHSLCTHERWTFFKEGKTIPTQAKCFLCTYEVNYHMGEPMLFGIMKEPIFV